MQSYNVNSFIFHGSKSNLVSCYCCLVAIEMLVKKYLRDRGSDYFQGVGHDIPRMLHILSSQFMRNDYALKSFKVRLENALQKHPCLDRHGNITYVPAKNYPYLRYVVHESDGCGVGAKDTDLKSLERISLRIFKYLSKEAGYDN